jgi:hypothetical protein
MDYDESPVPLDPGPCTWTSSSAAQSIPRGVSGVYDAGDSFSVSAELVQEATVGSAAERRQLSMQMAMSSEFGDTEALQNQPVLESLVNLAEVGLAVVSGDVRIPRYAVPGVQPMCGQTTYLPHGLNAQELRDVSDAFCEGFQKHGSPFEEVHLSDKRRFVRYLFLALGFPHHFVNGFDFNLSSEGCRGVIVFLVGRVFQDWRGEGWLTSSMGHLDVVSEA